MKLDDPLQLFFAILTVILISVVLSLIISFLAKPSPARDDFRLAFTLNMKRLLKRKVHIFVGINEHSKLMAASILKSRKTSIIFVNVADSFSAAAERQLRDELGSSKAVVLGGARPVDENESLAKAIGLPRIQKWFNNKKNSIYLFAQSPEENSLLLAVATKDNSIRAKIFHYSSKPNGLDTLIASTGARVRLLNPHKMAFMDIKLNHKELMPVNFVSKSKEGYVTKGLNALVIGFGNTGQEAVRFLYEYGSFVGKDTLRAPMSIKVLDPEMDSRLGGFLESAPLLRGDKAFSWDPVAAGTEKFWEEFEKSNANYIVVAVDNGPQNLQLAVSMLQAASRAGRDLSKMVILLRFWKESPKITEVLDFYNAAYSPDGVKVLRSFGGTTSIWNPDVISGKRLKKTAQKFNENKKFFGETESWDARRERLSKPGPDFLKNQMELHRLQAQDITRALYASTILSLAGEGAPDGEKLNYLTAQEHLHWMSSLAVMGYTNGPKDELRKIHPNMVPYPEIKNEKDRNLGLLAVKSMLGMVTTAEK